MIDLYDFLVAIGLGLVAAGLYLYDPRWALLTTGIALFAIGLFGAWVKSRS